MAPDAKENFIEQLGMTKKNESKVGPSWTNDASDSHFVGVPKITSETITWTALFVDLVVKRRSVHLFVVVSRTKELLTMVTSFLFNDDGDNSGTHKLSHTRQNFATRQRRHIRSFACRTDGQAEGALPTVGIGVQELLIQYHTLPTNTYWYNRGLSYCTVRRMLLMP